MPSSRKARTTRARRSRPTSNCLPGSVRATIRTLTWSRSRLSTPMTLGGSSSSGRRAGSRKASRPTSRRISLTRLTSTLVGIGTSTTARAQSRDRLTTLAMAPLGTVTTSPLEERIRVTRRVTSSTVPVAGSACAGDADRDDVAEAVLPLGDDEEAGQHVADDPLRAEAEPDAEHGRRRDQAGHRDAEPVEHEEDRDRVDQHDRHPGQHLGERVPVLGGLGAHEDVAAGRLPVDPVGDAAADPGHEAGQQDRAQDDQDDFQAAAGEPVDAVRSGGAHVTASVPVGSRSDRSTLVRPARIRPNRQVGQRGSTNSACADRPIGPSASKRTAMALGRAGAAEHGARVHAQPLAPRGAVQRRPARSTLAKVARCPVERGGDAAGRVGHDQQVLQRRHRLPVDQLAARRGSRPTPARGR